MRKYISWGVWLVCLILLGCVSPQDRAERYPEIFNALTPEQRELVLSGQITEGMPAGALKIAYGEPSEIREGVFEGQPVDSWVYTRVETDRIPHYRSHTYVDANGNVVVSEIYDPIVEHNRVPARVIFVRGGNVIGWQEL